MSNIVEFPVADRPITESEIDKKLHSEAFRNLEGEICDLDRMGEIERLDHELCGARRQLP
jgi:hypothetical protein